MSHDGTRLSYLVILSKILSHQQLCSATMRGRALKQDINERQGRNCLVISRRRRFLLRRIQSESRKWHAPRLHRQCDTRNLAEALRLSSCLDSLRSRLSQVGKPWPTFPSPCSISLAHLLMTPWPRCSVGERHRCYKRTRLLLTHPIGSSGECHNMLDQVPDRGCLGTGTPMGRWVRNHVVERDTWTAPSTSQQA